MHGIPLWSRSRVRSVFVVLVCCVGFACERAAEPVAPSTTTLSLISTERPVNATGLPPIAVTDAWATPEDTPLVVPAPGTLANDVDPDGSSFIMSNITSPSHGQLTSAVTNGSFTYVPDPGFVGSDSFTYLLYDADNNYSDPGTVNIEVYPDPNRAPVAIADAWATPQDTPLVVPAPGTRGNDIDPDGDPIIMSNITPPSHGQLTSAVTNGAFTYVPDPGFVGTDSFTYLLLDDHNAYSDPGTVTITVFDETPDTTAPEIILANRSYVLSPPNHRMREFTVADLVSAVGDEGDPDLTVADVVIAMVTSDEPDNEMGDGRTMNDIVIGPDCDYVQLRVERVGGGNGRVYTVELEVADASGNVGTAQVRVMVPVKGTREAVMDAPVVVVDQCGAGSGTAASAVSQR